MRKLPSSVLEASGGFKAHPERKRIDPQGQGDLGNSPTYFNTEQKKIWKEIKSQIPTGLAKSADRMMVEVVCRLMHKFRFDPKGLNASELSALINALAKIGCSPADRTKCAMPATKPDKNEFKEFQS